jgi:pantoate--beta-alanine ligase
MQVFRTIQELRPLLDAARDQGKSVGMVGTSGAMHQGHQSLIRRAGAENDVNLLCWMGTRPTHTFNTGSKISYDRDENRDFRIAEEAGAELLFAPASADLYPRRPMTRVTLPEMSTDVPHLEDPAHLDNICRAMCKLWNLIGPCRNYFGEKDWQQLVMFQRLAEDLFFPVEVIGSPTIRDDDGLATSSRNGQLSAEDRKTAPIIYRALCEARDAAQAGSARTATELQRIFTGVIGGRAEVRYFNAVESDTMRVLDELSGSVRLLASIQLGSTRLLDNLGLQLPG